MRIQWLAAVAACVVVAPLAAQSVTVPRAPTPAPASSADPATAGNPLPEDRGYDKDSARTRAIDASGRPAVQAANGAVLARSDAQTAAGTVAPSAQYEADVAVYRDALRAHRHDVRHYARQQQAYGEAMADWRIQVDACRRGKNAVCSMPAPDPADYM